MFNRGRIDFQIRAGYHQAHRFLWQTVVNNREEMRPFFPNHTGSSSCQGSIDGVRQPINMQRALCDLNSQLNPSIKQGYPGDMIGVKMGQDYGVHLVQTDLQPGGVGR